MKNTIALIVAFGLLCELGMPTRLRWKKMRIILIRTIAARLLCHLRSRVATRLFCQLIRALSRVLRLQRKVQRIPRPGQVASADTTKWAVEVAHPGALLHSVQDNLCCELTPALRWVSPGKKNSADFLKLGVSDTFVTDEPTRNLG